MTTIIFVCDTCSYAPGQKTGPENETGGEILARMVEAEAVDRGPIEVRRQSCLMGCDRHCNTAITANSTLTYVLGILKPSDASAGTIVHYACLHADSEPGRVPFKQCAQGAQGQFVAVIP